MQIGLASRHHRSDRDKADQVRTQTTTSAVFYPHAPGAPILPLPSMCFFDPRSKPYASERSAQRNAPTGVLQMPEGRIGQKCLFDRHVAGAKDLGRCPRLRLTWSRLGKLQLFWQLTRSHCEMPLTTSADLYDSSTVTPAASVQNDSDGRRWSRKI